MTAPNPDSVRRRPRLTDPPFPRVGRASLVAQERAWDRWQRAGTEPAFQRMERRLAQNDGSGADAAQGS